MIAALWAVLLGAAAPDFDLLIRGGRVADGTGNPSYRADVAVKQGRIAAVGALGDKTAVRTIDAGGLVVAPGFVDIHNHSDETLLVDGDAESMVRQGVTTMILGEGLSAAPSPAFPDFQAYFAALIKSGISTNVGSYVGSGTVWTLVHGERAGPPTAVELDRMREIVRRAMQQGALGVASSLSGPPGAWIDTDTLVALCEVAGEFGGIYSTHNRNEGLGVFDAVAEAIEIGRRARVPVDVIHLKISEHTLWKQMPRLVAQIQAARDQGLDVTANVYPYRAGQNDLQTILPPWAHEGGLRATLARLRDAGQRGRIRDEMARPGTDWENLYEAAGTPEGIVLVSFKNERLKPLTGRTLGSVAAQREADPRDVAMDLVLEDESRVGMVIFMASPENLRREVALPWMSFGSDAGSIAPEGVFLRSQPHPRTYGTFARVLGRFVRDEKAAPLEDVIRRMTGFPAANLKLDRRGLLRADHFADVTVFDPATIRDHATYAEPHQYATGVAHVLVNGTPVLRDGEHTGAHPGRVVFGPARRGR